MLEMRVVSGQWAVGERSSRVITALLSAPVASTSPKGECVNSQVQMRNFRWVLRKQNHIFVTKESHTEVAIFPFNKSLPPTSF